MLTNQDIRHTSLHRSKREQNPLPEIYECPYPDHITLGNLTYFWWAPTLVYQHMRPRSRKIKSAFQFDCKVAWNYSKVFLCFSEAPRFGEREIYTYWWNSPSVARIGGIA
jgi:hypothetical protein